MSSYDLHHVRKLTIRKDHQIKLNSNLITIKAEEQNGDEKITHEMTFYGEGSKEIEICDESGKCY